MSKTDTIAQRGGVVSMRKIVMKIFTAMNWIVGLVGLVSVCFVDCVSWFPTMVCALSLVYLVFAMHISDAIKERKMRRDRRCVR